MITFDTKCQILHDMYVFTDSDSGLMDFIELHDLGVPLAVCKVQGLAIPTPLGIDCILGDFDDLCEFLEIDKYADYESWEEVESLAESG